MSLKATHPQRTEFKHRLRSSRLQIDALFLLLSENKVSPVLSPSQHSLYLLNEVARLVQFQINSKQVPVLAKSFQDFVIETGTDHVMTSGEFIVVLRKWYRKFPIPLASLDSQVANVLRIQLQKTISEYKAHLKQSQDLDESQRYIQLIHTFKSQLQELQYGRHISFSSNLTRDTTPEEEKGLKEIFKFYASQHNLTGKLPTFEALTEDNASIDPGSFLQFCKDFGVYRTKEAVRPLRSLLKNELLFIYKKSTPSNRKMNFSGFLTSLDQISEEFFNDEYNQLHPGPCDCTVMPLAQKRILLYEMIGCGDPKHYTKACKPFRRAFCSSIEPGARIEKNDLSFRYKCRTTDLIREQVTKYREHKVLEKKEQEQLEKTLVLTRAKEAQLRIREKMEIEAGRRNRNLLKLEELPGMTSKDLLGEEKQELEDLISGEEDRP